MAPFSKISPDEINGAQVSPQIQGNFGLANNGTPGKIALKRLGPNCEANALRKNLEGSPMEA